MTASNANPRSQPRHDRGRWAVVAALRFVGFAAVWWILAEGDLRYPALALLAIGGATAASLALAPPGAGGWSPMGLARFAPYFVRQSVIGGVDVAIRSLSPRIPLDPGFIDCEIRLADEAARVLLAHTMSLMPGTLSVDLNGQRLRLHVLDRGMPVAERVRETEELIAGIFGRVDQDDNLARDDGTGR